MILQNGKFKAFKIKLFYFEVKNIKTKVKKGQ